MKIGESRAWGEALPQGERHEPDSRASEKLRSVLARRRALYEAVRDLPQTTQ
jgi:hypothetical protein